MPVVTNTVPIWAMTRSRDFRYAPARVREIAALKNLSAVQFAEHFVNQGKEVEVVLWDRHRVVTDTYPAPQRVMIYR